MSVGAASTLVLLERIRSGDERARELLFERYLRPLQRWAAGRLPGYARGGVDTDDLVQVSLLRALGRLDHFQPERQGAFLAYLRSILLNSIRDEIRRAGRRPRGVELSPHQADDQPSPLVEAIGAETLERYERALAALQPRQQEAVILRVELGLSHQQVADAIGAPSAAAARVSVKTALKRLAKLIETDVS